LKAEVNIGSLGLGLLYKLILTPAIIYLLYVVILNQNSKMIEVAIMESAMAHDNGQYISYYTWFKTSVK
jgi:hypothetical protein